MAGVSNFAKEGEVELSAFLAEYILPNAHWSC